MAGTSLYQDDETPAITDINVTPFVDVALVLLVVFMVTAKLIVARGVEVEKPVGSGGAITAPLRVTVTQDGKIFVNGDTFPDDTGVIAKIADVTKTSGVQKAIIAGDRRTAYGGVMHAIELLHQAGVTAIALENQQP
jgi:biopolymer transport protein ExbD